MKRTLLPLLLLCATTGCEGCRDRGKAAEGESTTGADARPHAKTADAADASAHVPGLSRGWQRNDAPFTPDPREVEEERRALQAYADRMATDAGAGSDPPEGGRRGGGGGGGAGGGGGGGKNRGAPQLVLGDRELDLDTARLESAGLARRESRSLTTLIDALAPEAGWSSVRLQRTGQEPFDVPRAALLEQREDFTVKVSGRGQLVLESPPGFGPQGGRKRPLSRIELLP